MNKVTVWLTSYNHEKYLRESIESILAQTYTQFTLYIVDDCSQDSSWEIIKEYQQKDSRIKIVRHEKNMGTSDLESYIKKLPGDYIAIAHSDDVWEKCKLERQLEYLELHPEVGACFTLVQLIDDNGMPISNGKDNIFQKTNRDRYEWLHFFFFNRNCLCHPSAVVRKAAYSDYQLFSKGLHGYPDFYQWVRMCKNAEIYIVQEELTKFRIHSGEENDSGERPENLNRIQIEEIFVMEQYKELVETHEVAQVFPETKQYVINGSMIEEYALAQMYLHGPGPAHWILGFKLLYDLFQDSSKADAIKEKYGYTKKLYNQDKQKYDIFNSISRERYLHTTLLFDKGTGYNENDCIKKIAYITKTGSFKVSYTLSEENCRYLQKIRVDLDEGFYRKFKIQKVSINGNNVNMCAINVGHTVDGWDEFYTVDPQYELQDIQRGILTISGVAQIMDYIQVERHFISIEHEKKQMKEDMEYIYKELETIKNSKAYKYVQLFNKIKDKFLR